MAVVVEVDEAVTLVVEVVAVGVTLVAEEVAVAEAPWSLRLLQLLYPLQVWHLLSQLVSV